jgi:inositol-hexakisphosphate/diphosphoinositol-pentakisphosphate 1-kinase
MLDRWRTLHRELYNEKKGGFDITKIPDVHDNIRYDCLHNFRLKVSQLQLLLQKYIITVSVIACVAAA